MLMTLPSSPDTIDAAYLESRLRAYSGEADARVASFDVQRMDKGTSGARLYRVSISLGESRGTQSFILKLGGGGDEALFYRDLAAHLPVETPRVLDARLLDDGGGWLLMEEITGVKSGLDWSPQDYRAVLADMARLHARFWNKTERLDGHEWLWRPDEGSLNELAAARRTDVEAIAASRLPEMLPEAFGEEKLALARRLLERPASMFGPMLEAGMTLVHGDYWFHNVQVTEAGRRVLVDWQGPMVWSGLWELAYFMNLLLPVSSSEYREELPVAEETMVDWYRAALAAAGVSLPKELYSRALLAAKVWHPMQHWHRQIGRAAANGWLSEGNIGEENPGAARFLAQTFSRWEIDAQALLNA
jgi:hypothetical protein